MSDPTDDPMIGRLEAMLEAGRDDSLLRFSLGGACLKAGHRDKAVGHLRAAVAFDAEYSAAWKLLGKALAESGEKTQAAEAFDRGINAAEGRGDIQAAKEMRVFRKRLEKP